MVRSCRLGYDRKPCPAVSTVESLSTTQRFAAHLNRAVEQVVAPLDLRVIVVQEAHDVGLRHERVAHQAASSDEHRVDSLDEGVEHLAIEHNVNPEIQLNYAIIYFISRRFVGN